jgi:hypothetical protein
MAKGRPMIFTTDVGNINVTIADVITDDFQFLMDGAAAERAIDYARLELGKKYEYSVVLSYNSIPYGFFLMCNGGRYAPNVLRVYTKLYTIPQFRSAANIDKFLLPGDTAGRVMYQSHSIIANFVEDILPTTEIKPYDLYFYSRAPGDTLIVSLMNKFARVKWTAVDDIVFLTGRKESDPHCWKHIVYKGDLAAFTQPSRPI